jgi:hypothetical protein
MTARNTKDDGSERTRSERATERPSYLSVSPL